MPNGNGNGNGNQGGGNQGGNQGGGNTLEEIKARAPARREELRGLIAAKRAQREGINREAIALKTQAREANAELLALEREDEDLKRLLGVRPAGHVTRMGGSTGLSKKRAADQS
jgi:hypothetical protein